MNHTIATNILREKLMAGKSIIKMYEGHPINAMHVMALFYPNIEEEVRQLEESIKFLEDGVSASVGIQNFVVIEQHNIHKEHVRVLYSGSDEEKAKGIFTEKIEKDETESWKVWVELWEDGKFVNTIEVY